MEKVGKERVYMNGEQSVVDLIKLLECYPPHLRIADGSFVVADPRRIEQWKIVMTDEITGQEIVFNKDIPLSVSNAVDDMIAEHYFTTWADGDDLSKIIEKD